jgi:hypothetical protein
MWDQLTPADFRRSRHILNLRRADTRPGEGGEQLGRARQRRYGSSQITPKTPYLSAA